ncbi:MAG: hypothetical protein V1659_05540 [Candidatus Woesearchaeota archaeon]
MPSKKRRLRRRTGFEEINRWLAQGSIDPSDEADSGGRLALNSQKSEAEQMEARGARPLWTFVQKHRFRVVHVFDDSYFSLPHQHKGFPFPAAPQPVYYRKFRPLEEIAWG